MNPLTQVQVAGTNARAWRFLADEAGFKPLPRPCVYHGGFAIQYHNLHKDLVLHTDDSFFTVNACLDHRAEGNEVVFIKHVKGRGNRELVVPAKTGYAVVHAGHIPHYTKALESGTRTNIVMWFQKSTTGPGGGA